MSFDTQTLYRLLPAIHRIRDEELAASMSATLLTAAEKAELAALEALSSATPQEQQRLDELRQKASRGPLASLLAVFAEQISVVEENLEQLYDDLFIETCADWVIPYIGDLIGYQSLHGVVPRVASPRAEVAHTIALRRRKGTATVLEQLARDVTGWDARTVEFFQLLATTQYMNHPRPHSRWCPNLRDAEALEWIGTAFESASRSVDVRHIESGRGRHNIPNVGLFLWRISAYPRRECPAARAGERRYRVSPLNHDVPLYNHPQAEDDITHLAEPINVPWPLTRRRLARYLNDYYGTRPVDGAEVDNAEPGLILSVNDTIIERYRHDPVLNENVHQIVICNLSDDGPSWAHTPPPAGLYAIDPELGRIALPPEAPDPADVRMTWHEGFSADVGGGEYERGDTLPAPAADVSVVRVPDDQATLTQALTKLGGSGVVEITDNGRYQENLNIQVSAGGNIEIRAANGRRPVLLLTAPMTVSGGEGSGFTLNGLLVTGERVRVPANDPSNDLGNALASLSLVHCTLVPGYKLSPMGQPLQPTEPSLVVEIPGVDIRIGRTILGGVRIHPRSALSATDSIIDATDPGGVAYAAWDAAAASDDALSGGYLALESCTVIGKVHASEFKVVSNSILLAEGRLSSQWPVPVRCERKQVGCVRFSFLPFAAIVPPCYRCQPDSEAMARRIAPRFTSLAYGTPAYCQLAATTPEAIRCGAEDEGEMGVFHHLYGAQREINLRVRLEEYLRAGLRAGIFYES